MTLQRNSLVRISGVGHQVGQELRKLEACLHDLNEARNDLGFLNDYPKLTHLIDEAIKEANHQASAEDEHLNSFI